MNDLTMTVSGWVATDPKHVVGPTGNHMTTFRLASTSRYFDRDKGQWVDGSTEWFTVRTFRSASITVHESVKKGQPVTVHGRFRTNEWESESGTRTDLVIDATSVGHDLTRGTAAFTRATGVADVPGSAREADAGVSESADASENTATSEDAVPMDAVEVEASDLETAIESEPELEEVAS